MRTIELTDEQLKRLQDMVSFELDALESLNDDHTEDMEELERIQEILDKAWLESEN